MKHLFYWIAVFILTTASCVAEEAGTLPYGVVQKSLSRNDLLWDKFGFYVVMGLMILAFMETIFFYFLKNERRKKREM